MANPYNFESVQLQDQTKSKPKLRSGAHEVSTKNTALAGRRSSEVDVGDGTRLARQAFFLFRSFFAKKE